MTATEVSETFTAVGTTAAALATSVRDLLPALDAPVEKARTAVSTETLLLDDEDRRFERHRRVLEASIGRQLDLLAKVRAVAKPATSGSFERAPQIELRVVRGETPSTAWRPPRLLLGPARSVGRLGPRARAPVPDDEEQVKAAQPAENIRDTWASCQRSRSVRGSGGRG